MSIKGIVSPLTKRAFQLRLIYYDNFAAKNQQAVSWEGMVLQSYEVQMTPPPLG